MNYAYNEEKMMEGIRAYRHKIIREQSTGCTHGKVNERRDKRGKRVCRLCQSACGRRHYLKNKDKIAVRKKEYRQKQTQLRRAV